MTIPVHISTLVVKPALDLMVRPSRSDLLARLIPNARLLTFPEAGHGIIRQCYHELNAALLEHFARQGRGQLPGM